MNMRRWKQSLSFLVCGVLIAATALLTTGCDGSKQAADATASIAPSSAVTPVGDAAPSQANDQVLGQGETSFTFTVVDGDGKESVFQIHTDQTTVGEALVELGLIEGEESEYGLYVKTVNGITVDYDTDGKYWAFYVDGAYAQSGVDATEVTEGSTYTFQVE